MPYRQSVAAEDGGVPTRRLTRFAFLKPLERALWQRARADLELDLKVAVALALDLGPTEVARKLDRTPAEIRASQARLARAGEDLR